MPKKLPTVLIMDDDDARHQRFRMELPIEATHVHTALAAEAELKRSPFNVVFLDHDLDEDGTRPGVYVTRKIRDGEISVPRGTQFYIHSVNPVGAKNMEDDLRDAGFSVRRIPFGTQGFYSTLKLLANVIRERMAE